MAASHAQFFGVGPPAVEGDKSCKKSPPFSPSSAFLGPTLKNKSGHLKGESSLRAAARQERHTSHVGPVRVVAEKVVGIDLGTVEGRKATIATNGIGQRTTPSVVAYTKNGDVVVAQIAKREAVVNQNTFFSFRRFIGRRMNDSGSLLRDSLEIGTSSKDLLVIGPGVLGKLVAQLWLKENEGSKVVGQTNTTNHHEELQAIGVEPVVKGQERNDQFPYVIFCAPPSGNDDYAAELRAAAARWNGEGSFLFTSSSAVYDVTDNKECDEHSPIVPIQRSPRTHVLLNAEEEVLKVSGNIVRLAGLYTLEQGAHLYYLKKVNVEARPDYVLNLIHYEDAASLCVAIMKQHTRGQVFLGCDNNPLSRQEIMDIVAKSGKFEQKFGEFTETGGPLGKRMNNNYSRLALGWEPKFSSFASCLGVAV